MSNFESINKRSFKRKSIIELILSNALTYKIYMLHADFVFLTVGNGYAEKKLLHYSTKAKRFG